MKVKYREIHVKHALARSKLPGVEYSLNPYRGCEHHCIYCYSPFVLHRSLEEWNSVVYVKKNIPTILDRELKKIKDARIFIGTVTDAYQPAEKKYEITKKSLEVLLKHNARINILTKSSLILRDRDKIAKFKDVEVGVSVSTLNEKIRKKTEPGASCVEDRFSVLEKFAGEVKTYIFLSPIFSYTLLDLEEIFQRASKVGVDYIIADRFRYREGMALPQWMQNESLDINLLKTKLKELSKCYHIHTVFAF